MSDAPKPMSEKLEALAAEFNDLAARSKAAAAKLQSAAFEAKSAEIRAELNKVLDEFIPTVDKSALKGHDIVFLINKSEGMGEGFASPIGAAIDIARSLHAATGGHDTAVSAGLWEAGNNTKWVNLSDSDRMEKAREKTKTNGKELLPVAKDIMIANTPDKQGERKKHYIVVSTGSVSDNIDHTAQMLNTAMQMNPRVTVDFISFGSGEGNIKDLAAKLTPPTDAQKSGVYNVAKHEELHGAVMSVLTGRFAGVAPEAPKVVVEETKTAAPVATETKPDAPVVAEVKKPEAPAVIVETAVAASAPETPKAGPAAPAEGKGRRRWIIFGPRQ
ncbi:MAG: hypothetical protein EPN97_17845 [Alphaproteobacteria bacterium]|nr:MAG: hypothetical protein EPN97_17845 [Alphaproteobacteria bacterium]